MAKFRLTRRGHRPVAPPAPAINAPTFARVSNAGSDDFYFSTTYDSTVGSYVDGYYARVQGASNAAFSADLQDVTKDIAEHEVEGKTRLADWSADADPAPSATLSFTGSFEYMRGRVERLNDDGTVTVSPWSNIIRKSAGSHSYWRIRTIANSIELQSSDDFVVIQEAQMRATSGGADQCAGGTAISGGYQAAHGSPAAVFNDGTGGGVWLTTLPGWVGYQFASPVSVVEVTITAAATNGWHEYAPGAFYIEYSDDGITWTLGWYVPSSLAWTSGLTRTFTSDEA